MDSKSEVMVALGTAIGVNCIPCFDHLYARSKEVGLTDQDIKDITLIAEKVKGGAAMFIKKAVSDVAGEFESGGESCCADGGGCV